MHMEDWCTCCTY